MKSQGITCPGLGFSTTYQSGCWNLHITIIRIIGANKTYYLGQWSHQGHQTVPSKCKVNFINISMLVISLNVLIGGLLDISGARMYHVHRLAPLLIPGCPCDDNDVKACILSRPNLLGCTKTSRRLPQLDVHRWKTTWLMWCSRIPRPSMQHGYTYKATTDAYNIKDQLSRRGGRTSMPSRRHSLHSHKP
jgi:hypothetical protein